MSIPTINLKVIVPSLFTIALSRMVIHKLSSHSVIISVLLPISFSCVV